MEIRSDGYQSRFDKIPPPLPQPLSSSTLPTFPRTRLHTWFVRICWGILIWTFLVHFVTVRQLWNPKLFIGLTNHLNKITHFSLHSVEAAPSPTLFLPAQPVLLPPLRIYNSNGYLKVSCNGGLNQMRAAICDMVTVARFLNLTLVVPELDKRSFWADPSNFGDIFDKDHFINSLRDEVRIIKRLPKKLGRKLEVQELEMPPVSWSNEKYYLQQILPLFSKYQVIHFNRTDTRLANNGLPIDLQRLRCRVNFQALKFTPRIEALGNKLVQLLQEKGSFVALHLRYEMDMLAFSGCSHGCSEEEANELKTMRYAYPWWREKELVSEERRSQGMCPLTPEEAALVLRALGFERDTQIYIASGEIYGSERRLSALRAAFPRLVKKEMLLESGDLQQFQNHSSQMAALDFTVSVASNIFVPTYDGNMAKLVEGHRRHLGFKKTIVPDRKKLVELIDFYQNKTLSWDEFVVAVRMTHEDRQGKPSYRKVIVDKPKEEDYFYANPHECLSENK